MAKELIDEKIVQTKEVAVRRKPYAQAISQEQNKINLTETQQIVVNKITSEQNFESLVYEPSCSSSMTISPIFLSGAKIADRANQ